MKTSDDSWEKKIQPDDLKFRDQVVEFVKQRLPLDARSPRKRTWGVSFGVEEGGPVYVNVSLDWQRREPKCCVTFNRVAMDSAGGIILILTTYLYGQYLKNRDGSYTFFLSKETWADIQPSLEESLEKMVERAKCGAYHPSCSKAV